MKKIKIGVPTAGFIDWGGGVDFVKMLIRGLIASNKYELVLLIPSPLTFRNQLKNTIKRSLNLFISFLNLLGFKKSKYKLLQYTDKSSLFGEFEMECSIAIYRANTAGLKHAIKKHQIELLVPCINVISYRITIPWIGYLYDFQHKYLPQFFGPEEIKYRENQFKNMLQSAPGIIVNSKAVKEDIFKFFANTQCKVFNLPFTPIFNKKLLLADYTFIKEKYSLPQKYFIISNQFWQHKSHLTAFQALKLVLEKSKEEVSIVCTGELNDYRDATYFSFLKSRIRDLGIEDKILFLGYIPKEDQIQIILHSISLIQPTLFEGGPGGGAAYDAIAFGKTAIISDININKEIDNSLVIFFKTSNYLDLANKMLSVLSLPANNYSEQYYNELEEASDNRIRALGVSLNAIIDGQLNNKNPDLQNQRRFDSNRHYKLQ